MTQADRCFIDTCRQILDHGWSDQDVAVRTRWPDGSPAHTRKAFGIVNRYQLDEGFPMLTLRRVPFSTLVKEILWIWVQRSNRVEDLGAKIWDAWADEEGTIGRAYGYQLGVRHHYPEGDFDQVERVLYDLKHNRYSRRILTSLYNHHDLHQMRLYPCAWSLTLNVCGDRLNAILNQRSQDMLAANAFNVAQYAVLVHMFARVSGLKPGELVHVIADAHIYDRHEDIVRELIERPGFAAPTLEIDPTITDFFAYRLEHFALRDYKHGPAIPRFEVAI
ncbi:MAG: thymidylate synthase [Bacillota bacterium]|nr:thymidylate synthase [Bacillota bacterium]